MLRNERTYVADSLAQAGIDPTADNEGFARLGTRLHSVSVTLSDGVDWHSLTSRIVIAFVDADEVPLSTTIGALTIPVQPQLRRVIFNAVAPSAFVGFGDTGLPVPPSLNCQPSWLYWRVEALPLATDAFAVRVHSSDGPVVP